jgi:HD-like signal output (HDOD) protein
MSQTCPTDIEGPRLIERALPDVRAWADCFDARRLPVLASTAATLERLREDEEAVDAHLLSELVGDDPLLTIKVFAHVAELRRGREGSDAETLTAALVMLGITPFFRAFVPLRSVDQHLAALPWALQGLQRVLDRSHRAARFAAAFALQRMDRDVAVIQEAALLHDFAEGLLWLTAPRLARDIEQRQAADSQLRSAQVQQQVLNIQLADLQQELMQRWRLPRLLTELADDRRSGASAPSRTVELATRLARHTQSDWHNAALPDDVAEIAALLHMSPEATLAVLREVDGEG